jgi:23S rRNA (uracil1939-C5)-methyltransferase
MPVNDETIVRVAARGEGVTATGRHVPLAAPGDRVFADGTILPGDRHRTAPCRHYPQCGGCQLQHLDDRAYAQYLADRVDGALKAQGLATEWRGPLISPPRTRRRATLHAERRGRQVHLGFTQAQSHHLIDLDECWVLAPELFALLQPLRGLLAAQLPQSGRIDVHLTLADQGIDVLLKGRLSEGLAAAEAITAFARRHHLARVSIDDAYGPEARWEPEPVTITLGGVAVPLPAGAFLQATRQGEAALTQAARAIVGDARTVADLFAGIGTFALSLPPETRAYAAEGAREAILSLKGAAARAGRQVFADHRDLFRRRTGSFRRGDPRPAACGRT